MYINKIDELIDNLLDDFEKKLEKSSLFKEIKNESNFVKFQNKINDFIKKFIDSIDKKILTSLIPNETNVNTILSIMTRYIAYYIYLAIAYYYNDDRDLYATNIIECSKNQKVSIIQINDFFNSENNAMLINFFTIIKNIKILVNLKNIDKIQQTIQNNPILYQSTILFFNSLGKDFIVEHFMIPDNMHNIIKTIIFRELYLKNEKKEVYDILNQKEKENAEYRYINIVVSKDIETLDYNAIEKLFSIKERRIGLVDEIYEFLEDFNNKKSINFINNEDKAKILFEKKILIPITEDFLRFHKNTETYESNDSFDKQSTKEKENTKLKYIVNRMNSIINYYSPAIQNNNKLKIEVEKLFYKPLYYRNAILYNDYEEIRLLKKLENIGKKGDDDDQIEDLINFRKYAYQNFKDFNNDGLRLRFNNTIDAIRDVSIKYFDKKRSIQYRVGSKDMDLMIVGAAFYNSNSPLQCAISSQLINSNKITNTDNGYKAMNKLIKKKYV